MEKKYLGFILEYDFLNCYYDVIKKNNLVPLNRINNSSRANTVVHFVSFSEKKTKASDKKSDHRNKTFNSQHTHPSPQQKIRCKNGICKRRTNHDHSEGDTRGGEHNIE